MIRSLIAAVLLSVSAAWATAPQVDNRTALERYEADSKFALYACRLKLQLVIIKTAKNMPLAPEDNWRGCIADAKATLPVGLADALRTVRKPMAAEALKTYHVAVMSALNAMEPASGELSAVHAARVRAMDLRAQEAWERFLVER